MKVVLEVNKISKSFGKKQALSDVSFKLHQGEIVGFVGPNGSGKSTTMKCIASLIYADKGSINICGYDLKKHRNQALSNVAVQIEYPSLYPELSGLENLKIFASMKKANKKEIADVVSFMNIGDNINRKAGTYSMGMKQRLCLATSLLSNPKILILDEPTNGLDPDGVFDLRNKLLQLTKQGEITIFVSSHNLSEIEKIADRIIWIQNGKVIEDSDILSNTKYVIETENEIDKQLLLDLSVYEPIKKAECEYNFKCIDNNTVHHLIDHLIRNGVIIADIEKAENTLEDKYHELIGK